MVQLAPIIPPKLVPHLREEVQDYNFVIATKHPVELVQEYYTGIVIVDNGAYEDGTSADPEMLADYAAAIVGNGREVVVAVPDVIADAEGTVLAATKAIPYLRRAGAKLLGIPQGVTQQEVLECARRLYILGVDWFGVPKHLRRRLGTRVYITRALARAFRMPIHLLGFSDVIADDLASLRWPHVTGIDSATPVWAGATGGFIHLNKESGHRPIDFWEWSAEEVPLEQVREYIRNFSGLVRAVL